MSNPTNPLHHRRSIRLRGFDYASENGYFVTLVTQARANLFGEIRKGEMALNELGTIAVEEWFKTKELRPYVELLEDEFVVMPNHIHGIIWIVDTVGAYCNTPLQMNTNLPQRMDNESSEFRSPSIGLGAIIRGYKSAVTKRINILRGTPAEPVFQRNYYEHIIGTEREYDRIAEYIVNNPINWCLDDENKDKNGITSAS